MANGWREEYDIIIMDSPPVGRVADAMVLASACDGVLLVVGHGNARVGDVKHSLGRLVHANVIGFALNAIELPKRSYPYYYGKYGSSGRYGSYYYYRRYYGEYYGRKYGYGYGDGRREGESAKAAEPQARRDRVMTTTATSLEGVGGTPDSGGCPHGRDGHDSVWCRRTFA